MKVLTGIAGLGLVLVYGTVLAFAVFIVHLLVGWTAAIIGTAAIGIGLALFVYAAIRMVSDG
jgi:hypothetical protein